MQFQRTNILAAVALTTLAWTATQAVAGGGSSNAIDITGSWTGQIKCKGIDYDGDRFKDTQTGTIFISTNDQSPSAFAVDTSSLVFDGRGGGPSAASRCGETVELGAGSGKGQATIGPMGVADVLASNVDDIDFGAVYLKTVQVFPVKSNGTTGALKGKSTLLPFKGVLGECKWKFARTNDADPNVDTADCFQIAFPGP